MWKKLVSSNLRRVRYFKKSQLLAVEFKGGRIWIYGFVPWSIYMRLLSAPSHGKYFNREIRNKPRIYPYMEVPWKVALQIGLVRKEKQ